jgi:hypothetical protein
VDYLVGILPFLPSYCTSLSVYTGQNPRPHVVLIESSQMRTIITCLRRQGSTYLLWGDLSLYICNSYLLHINFVHVKFVYINFIMYKIVIYKKKLCIKVLSKNMLHIDFTLYKKRNVKSLFCINFVTYISIFLRINFAIINFVNKPHTDICLCTYLQKFTTPRRESDVRKIKKQTDSFQAVYILYNSASFFKDDMFCLVYTFNAVHTVFEEGSLGDAEMGYYPIILLLFNLDSFQQQLSRY